VNKTLTIDNFELIFSEKNNSKFNISSTLGPKITKSPPRDHSHQGLSNNTKSSLAFP
jgi:hypothetical protein